MLARLAGAPGCEEASNLMGAEPRWSSAETLVTAQITCGLPDHFPDESGGGRASRRNSSLACWRLRLDSNKFSETAI